MGSFEGHQARYMEVVNPCVCMAADGRQGYRGLSFDGNANGTMKLSAKGMSFRMEVEAAFRAWAHQIHLGRVIRVYYLIHSLKKLNRKAEAQDFVLRGLSL